MIITTEDIMERMELHDKLPEIIEYLGCADMLDDVYVHTGEALPAKPIIRNAKDLKEYMYSISKATIVHFSINENDENGKEYCLFRLDLWKHAGYPGGEDSLYVGRIDLLIEAYGFLLLAAKIT